MSDKVECVLDARALLGEGPVWHRQRLLWVDILEEKLHVFNPTTGKDRAYDMGQFIGCVVPRKKGGVMVALHRGFAEFDFKKLTPIRAPRHRGRFNDGKCDPAGRFWAGTMDLEMKPGAASLYCMDTDRTIRRMLTGVTISNGLAWSADARTMFYIDTPTRAVAAFDFDRDSGNISNRREVIRIAEGWPDGMTIDAEGMLWIAHWGGWRVTRWNPKTGKLLRTIRLPVERVTSCTFGGAKLDTLYITSARTQLTEAELAKQPLAGGLFCVRPGVTGVEADEYAG